MRLLTMRTCSARTQTPFGPVHGAELKSTNVDARTFVSAPGLRLLAVSWHRALARYAKDDSTDARAIVRPLYWRYERMLADARAFKEWVVGECAAMG
jgi:hypothetical protein